jgi:hypothetical protein
VSAQTNDGSISGQVVNKTAGGGPVGGASVRLVTFGRQEAAPLGQRTTQSSPDGRFSFDQLDRDPNLIYVPFVRYAEISAPATASRRTSLGQKSEQPLSLLRDAALPRRTHPWNMTDPAALAWVIRRQTAIVEHGPQILKSRR